MVIAWVQIGHGTPTPLRSELEVEGTGSYLSFKMGAGDKTYRQEIDPKRLLKLLPAQWEGVEYLYPGLIQFPSLPHAGPIEKKNPS